MFYQYLLTFLAFIGIIVGVVLFVCAVAAISCGLDKLKTRHGWFEKIYSVVKKVLTVIACTIGGLLVLMFVIALFIDLHSQIWG